MRRVSNKCSNFGYPHQNKLHPLRSASPLISAAPNMWHLLEIVPYTNNVYTKMHIEQVYDNGALQKLFVFTYPAITCSNFILFCLIEGDVLFFFRFDRDFSKVLKFNVNHLPSHKVPPLESFVIK